MPNPPKEDYGYFLCPKMDGMMIFNDTDLDLLKEISNIGAGNAACALSKMIGVRVEISVPDCSLVGFSKITDMLGGPETVLLGVLVRFAGDLEGFILMVQEPKDAANTLNVLMDTDFDEEADIGLDALEPMKEVCNILAGSYLTAISGMTGLKITACVPEMTMDMAMAIMNVPALVYGETGEYVLVLDTRFGGRAAGAFGHFFLIPTVDSFRALKERLLSIGL
jgi:chemotaxis protein CheC